MTEIQGWRKYDALFKQSVLTCLRKFVDGNGRARRAEFWSFFVWVQLFPIVIGFVLGFLDLLGLIEITQDTVVTLNGLVVLILCFPLLSVGARRLHDTGRSGWWQLLYITIIGIIPLIIWFATKGTGEANEYGEPIILTEKT